MGITKMSGLQGPMTDTLSPFQCDGVAPLGAEYGTRAYFAFSVMGVRQEPQVLQLSAETDAGESGKLQTRMQKAATTLTTRAVGASVPSKLLAAIQSCGYAEARTAGWRFEAICERKAQDVRMRYVITRTQPDMSSRPSRSLPRPPL